MVVNNLARFREAYHSNTGISLEELAAKARVSFSTIYRMEKGKDCGKNSIGKVADVLKVKMSELTKEEV